MQRLVDRISNEELERQIASVPHWYHRIEFRRGIVTPGVNDSPLHLQYLNLPADCSGMRVLDLGTRDGFFAFELERRGAAEVVAIDSLPSHQTGFGVASRLLESKVVYHHANLYNLERLQLGTFDLVLFLGLLYHLPDPLGGLRIVRQHCRARMFLETVIVDYGLPLADGTTVPLQQLDPRLAATPIMRFFPRDSFHQDASNYWGPNMQCVRDMLTEMEFSVVRESTDQSRAIFECVVASRPELAYAWGHATGRTPLS